MQILAGVILLGILIIFHELGHFLFAKMLGVRVLVFSLGFGPKLLSFKIGETEYRLSAIPLGGYIRMFGESLEEQPNEADRKISFMHQAIWRKSLIAFAGPFFNFILPVLLLFSLSLGQEQVLIPRIGTVLPGGVADQAGMLPGDKIISIDGKKIYDFGEMAGIIANSPSRPLNVKIERSNADGSQAIVALRLTPDAQASMNPIEQDKMVGRIGIMPAVMEPVVVLDDSSIFKKENLLQNFDKIIEVDNKPIKSVQALDDALENLWPSSVIKIEREGADGKKQELVIQAPNQGLKQILEADVIIKNTAVADADTPKLHTKIEATESLLVKDRKKTFAHWGVALAMGSIKELKENSPAASLGLKKGDRIVSVNGERLLSQFHLQQSLLQNMKKIQVLGVVTPAHDMFVYAFKLPDSIEENFKLDAGLPDIFGISLPNVFHQGETIGRNVGPIEAFNRSIKQTYSIISMTTKSIWMLIKGDAPASSIGGPIQLFDVAQQAAHKGLSYYLYVMCLLSVNLGLLNLLPIPALDGGHLLLFAIEAIQRKPLTIRTRAIAMQIGFAILLSIMVLAVFNDISRLFR